MRLETPTLTIALLALLSTSSAAATEITLTPSQDNTLFESATGSLSGGGGSRIFAGRTNQPDDSLRRALVQFDVAGNLPAGSTIQAVTLTLQVARTRDTDRAMGLHRVLIAWGEGTVVGTGFGEGIGGTADPGDATWTHAQSGSTPWNTAGGDFNPTASATATVTVTSGIWESPSLIDDVQDMLDNPGNNFGWLVLGLENRTFTARAFHSREAAANLRPTLQITYDEPIPVAPTSWGRIKALYESN